MFSDPFFSCTAGSFLLHLPKYHLLLLVPSGCLFSHFLRPLDRLTGNKLTRAQKYKNVGPVLKGSSAVVLAVDDSPPKLAPPEGCKKVTGHVRPVPSLFDSTKLRRDSARAACSDAPSLSAAIVFRRVNVRTHDSRKPQQHTGDALEENSNGKSDARFKETAMINRMHGSRKRP